MNYKERLKEFVEVDEIYQKYKKGDLTELSDFDKFCIQHCEDIEKILKKAECLQTKIDEAIEILKEHFVEEYIRSCDTSDGVGRYEIDIEHWTYKVYETLKDSDEDE